MIRVCHTPTRVPAWYLADHQHRLNQAAPPHCCLPGQVPLSPHPKLHIPLTSIPNSYLSLNPTVHRLICLLLS